MQFKRGDTVQLKSGGPIMTIMSIDPGLDGTPMLSCVWFAGQAQQYGTFQADTVKAVIKA